jgi:hypothetical protein
MRLIDSVIRFVRCRRGATAVMFGLALVPIAAIAGGAMDVSRAYFARTKLQASLDGAVLSGVSQSTSNQITTATNTFTGNFAAAGVYVSSSQTTFTNSSGILKGTAQATVPLVFLKVVGLRSYTLASTASAKLAYKDESCILTYGKGMSTTTAAMNFNGAPSVNLTGCGLRSNVSMNCNGHNGAATSSVAYGSASGCSNPIWAPPVPDIYASKASNISLQCSNSPGANWTNANQPGSPKVITVSKGTYNEYHVCGDLNLSGTGTMAGLTAGTDSVVIVENGNINVANNANLAAPQTTFVLAGAIGSNHTITFPNGNGKTATLSIEPSQTSTNPWKGVAIYVDPKLTSVVDMTWGPGATLKADGLIYMPNTNLTMNGNGISNNSKCTKFAVNTFTSNGNIDLSFLDPGCTTLGVNQWPGQPYLTN